jgi:hypothetical protein
MRSMTLSQSYTLMRQNFRLARLALPDRFVGRIRAQLHQLTTTFGFSLALGDVLYIQDCWYITNAGLLRLALRRGCAGIDTTLIRSLSDPGGKRWVFKAIAYRSYRSKGFVGYGDADPSNTSSLVRGAEMRVAETRAVNRALRKAYGIGLCSVEELGSFSGSKSFEAPQRSNGHHSSNGSNNGQPRLRDQLCLLIRQYNLDPTLVKAYAAAFCGTATLKEASRDLVESFISELATSAKNDPDNLLCKLNSYAQPAEVKL